MSDIHHSISPNSEELRDRLFPFLKKICINSPIDYIFVTGDFRYAKKQLDDQLAKKQAVDFLNEIMNATGAPKGNLILVPGNHDCERSISDRKKTIGRLRKEFSTIEYVLTDKDVEILESGFGFFQELKSDLYGNPRVCQKPKGNPHSFKICEDFNVLCLNTALTSLDDNDEGKLIIGMNFVRDLLNEITDNNKNPIIVLAHHNTCMWKSSERNYFENLIKGSKYNVCLMLCGHEHVMNYDDVDYNNISDVAKFVTGTMSQDKFADYGFYTGGLDNELGQGIIFAYIGNLNNFNWGEDTTFNPYQQDGRKNCKTFNYTSKHKYNTVKVFMHEKEKKGFETVQKLINLKIRNNNRDYSIRDLFDYILDCNDSHIFLSGTGGAGKTTILRQIQEYCCQKSNIYPPVIYVPLKDCSDNVFARINKTYEIGEEFLTSNFLKRSEKYIILLDALNEVNLKNQEAIIEQIVRLTEGNNICVLTSRTDSHIFYRCDLSNKFEMFKILPLTDKQKIEYLGNGDNVPPKMILNILDTPLMIKLYRVTQETIYNYSSKILIKYGFRGFSVNHNDTKTNPTLLTAGEVFWNYYRSQHLKIREQSHNINLKEKAIDCILPALARYLNDNHETVIRFNKIKENLQQYPDIKKCIEDIKKDYSEKSLNNDDVWHKIIVDILTNELGLLGSQPSTYGSSLKISFAHESLRDFFTALHLYNEKKAIMEDCITLSNPTKNPIDIVKRYLIEITDADYIQNNIIRDFSLSTCARALANVLLGDIYYFKGKYNYTTFLTKDLNRDECLKKSLEYYKKAVNLGGSDLATASAYWNIGIVCRILCAETKDSESRKKYAKEALKNTEESCRLGYSYGYNQMGVLYLEGIGTEKNIEKARHYFQKGVEMGVAHSYNRLGKMEEDEAKRQAENKNNEKAKYHYQKAFEIFFEQARNVCEEYALNRLTYYYFDGIPFLGKINISELGKDKKYCALKSDPDGYMNRLLNMAALAGNEYAIKRRKRISSK